MVTFLKCLVFYPMLFLRGILQLGLRFIGGILFFGAILLYFIAPGGSREQAWISMGFSFVLFLVGWFYDVILIKLNPNPDVMLILND